MNYTPLPPNGSYVLRGQVIGYEGNTGFTIPDGHYHLHLETRHGAVGPATCGFDGTPVDPYGVVTPGTYMWTTNPPSYATNRAHPRGTLIQAEFAAVSVLHAGYRRRVESQEVLFSWYETNGHEIVPVTYSEANQYPYCCRTGYRPGKLVKNSVDGKIYFITNEHPTQSGTPEYMLGKKRYVQTPEILEDCFPAQNPAWIITDWGGVTLADHGTGVPISVKCSEMSGGPKHPNGTIVQVPPPASSVYILENGNKRHLLNPNAQASWDIYLAEDIVQISTAEGNSYPLLINQEMVFQPGTLIQRPPPYNEVYFVTNEGDFIKASKRHVANPTTLYCLFPDEYIRPVSLVEASKHPTGSPISVSTC
jgi:hypothetical protein